MLLVTNGRVITRDADNAYLENGAVAIDGEKIAEVGDAAALAEKYPEAEVVDAHGGVIMPGLVNCHTHIYSGLARGLSIKGCNPTNFLENLEQQWWKIDDNLTLDGTRASAYATVLDSLRDGVTTIFDHHASFCEIPGSLFAIKDVCEETGIRACLCYETSDRRGDEKRDQAIAENAEFAQWAAKQDSGMIAAMFGGHATFTLSDETMDKMAEANNGLTGFHIHVCEGMNDVWDSRRKRGGISPIERLLQHDLLGPRTMLGHCIHVTPAEMDIIKETGTHIVNNPESNMATPWAALRCSSSSAVASRCTWARTPTPTTCWRAQGLPHHPASQRRHAQRGLGRGHDDALPEPTPPWRASTSGGQIGVLRPGAAADVIVMDYPVFTPFSDENVDGHMLFGMMGKNCRTTIVNGKVLYKDREFVAFDEERINAWTLEQSKALWGTLNERAY